MHKITRTITIIGTCLFAMFGVSYLYNTYITHNISISEPTGYYLKLPINKIEHGKRYMICLNDQKYILILKKLGLPSASNECPHNSPYLIKQVAAVPNDTVDITESGILVNGIYQNNSKQFKKARGVNLEPIAIGFHKTLGYDEYFMLGITPNSVDSRYFGIVKREQFIKRTVLLMTE